MDTEATFLSFFLVPLTGKNYIFLNSLSFVICMEKTKSDLADFQIKKTLQNVGEWMHIWLCHLLRHCLVNLQKLKMISMSSELLIPGMHNH